MSPATQAPTLSKIKRSNGVAGEYQISVMVQYPDRTLSFKRMAVAILSRSHDPAERIAEWEG